MSNDKLRILLIGDFSGKGDEGLTQISKKILFLIGRDNNVLYFNTRATVLPWNLVKIFKFNPDVIHYITGLTLRSLILSKIIKFSLFNRPKILISAIRVFLKNKKKKIIKFIAPDLILTQASKWEEVFQKNNIATYFLPNPINTKKFNFHAIDKSKLKEKYKIRINEKILLHVGHIKKNREINFIINNRELFKELGLKVLIVGSTFQKTDTDLLNKLKDVGFFVINEYIPEIEEIYLMADIYLFPIDGLNKEYFPPKYDEIGVIDMPLSILEALCCGMPVVTPQIDALKNLMNKKSLYLPIFLYDKSNIRTLLLALKQAINYNTSTNNLKSFVSDEKIRSELNIIYGKLTKK